MTDIRADQVQAGDAMEGWQGYVVKRWEAHPTNPALGRVVLCDRYGMECWTPKSPGEVVTVTRTEV